MKNFYSSFEKKIIDKILELDNEQSIICIQNIIADESGLLGTPGEFDFCNKSDSSFTILYQRDLNIAEKKDVNFMSDIERKLYDIVLLLEYFEEEKYIIVINSNRKFIKSESSFKQTIPLTVDLQARLSKYWNKDIKILMKLKILQEHKYLDESIYEAKRNTKWYIILTVATIVVSLLSIIVQICLSKQDNIQKVSMEKINDNCHVILDGTEGE